MLLIVRGIDFLLFILYRTEATHKKKSIFPNTSSWFFLSILLSNNKRGKSIYYHQRTKDNKIVIILLLGTGGKPHKENMLNQIVLLI